MIKKKSLFIGFSDLWDFMVHCSLEASNSLAMRVRHKEKKIIKKIYFDFHESNCCRSVGN